MISKYALIWISVIIGCIAGCSALGTSPSPCKINSAGGMVEYLQKQNLPALKSVEVWDCNYGLGLKLTTAHYEILTTLLDPLMLSQIPGFMESAYRGYNGQLPIPIDTKTIFTVYLFAERKQWEDFTAVFAGPQASLYRKIKAGAYYLNGACVAYNIGRERTFSVLGHEGWHQFNSRHFKFRLPSWLDEGIAMLFEASRYDQGMFYFEPSRNMYRLGALKITLMKDKMISLKDLIGMNPGEALAASDDAVTAFYGQSYAMVRFLREEGYGKRLASFHRLLLGGLEGTWPLGEEGGKIASDRNIPITVQRNQVVGRLLFKQYISDEPELVEMEKEYTAFCRKIVYHVHLRE